MRQVTLKGPAYTAVTDQRNVLVAPGLRGPQAQVSGCAVSQPRGPPSVASGAPPIFTRWPFRTNTGRLGSARRGSLLRRSKPRTVTAALGIVLEPALRTTITSSEVFASF